MERMKDRITDQRGTTIVELTVAVAIIAIVFAAIMPLFAGIRHSADTRWTSLEMVQNARVLNEQLCRYLAGARRIAAVSAGSSDDGYLQFEGADGTVYRYALGAGSYVEFGPVGDLHELAGPVEYLRFVCFDGTDFTHPTPDVNDIRLVTWEAGITSSGGSLQAKRVTGACHLRAAVHETATDVARMYDCASQTSWWSTVAFRGEADSQVPTSESSPAESLSFGDYGRLTQDDGDAQVIAVAGGGNYAQIRFAFTIEEDRDDVTGVGATWNGRGVNDGAGCSDGATLYLWDWESSRYELLQASENTDAEVTLTATREPDASRFVGGLADSRVQLLVVSNDRKSGADGNQLFTDYVKVETTTATGAGAILP